MLKELEGERQGPILLPADTLPSHVVLAKESRIVFFHILMNEHENSFPEPARFVGYLVLFQITIHNPQFLLAHQAHDALFAFRLVGCCFRTRFVSLSHISCKINVPAVNSKQKKRNFVSRKEKRRQYGSTQQIGKGR